MNLTISIIQLDAENDHYWRASIRELDGCCAYGKTPEDALRELGNVLAAYLRCMQEDGETLARKVMPL